HDLEHEGEDHRRDAGEHLHEEGRPVGGIGIGEIEAADLAIVGELQEALEHMPPAAARAASERPGLQRVELRPAMAGGIHESEIVTLLHRRAPLLACPYKQYFVCIHIVFVCP